MDGVTQLEILEMKKLIAVASFLLAANSQAGAIHLVCEGDVTKCSGTGYERDCRAENALRELRLSEEEGTMHYLKPAETVFGRAKWVEAKNVNFSDDKISGEVKGGLSLLGASMTLSIDRYTGVMTDDTWQGEDRWACRAVATERAF